MRAVRDLILIICAVVTAMSTGYIASQFASARSALELIGAKGKSPILDRLERKKQP